jgi:predicted RNA-binding Zn-ribbon protein involved in translation (DUF1610 family)
MTMTILRKKTGYALGLLLCIIGILLLGLVLWKLWEAEVFSSPDFFSALTTQLNTSNPFGLGLKLLHHSIIGVILFVVGVGILVARREKIQVVEEVTALLECPRCGKQWDEPIGKEQLKSMGYPQVKTLSRRKCPSCGKFIRPKIVTTRS